MPESDLSLLIDAARSAAGIAMAHWRKGHQSWDKPDGAGPVTDADLAVDRMLRDRLLAARPGYGWLSEETEDSPERLEREHVFIVDPIDGTRAFIAGEENWAHSLAVARDGQVTAAVILMPAKGLEFAAALGKGAARNGTAIRASSRTDIDGATVLAARSALEPRHWLGGTPPLERHFRASLAYRLALVAEGRFDASLTLRDTWEWDAAAGHLLIAEAGGTVSDRTGAPPLFNRPQPKLQGLLAAGGGLHRDLCARLDGDQPL